MVVKMLCRQIQKMQEKPTMIAQRLELMVKRGQLLKLRSERSCFRIDRKRPPVSLQQVIKDRSRPLTEKTKRIPAVLLSYAVLHLHGPPWLQPTWDSSQILFFQTSSSRIPLRPFIPMPLSGQDILADYLGPGCPTSDNFGSGTFASDEFESDDFGSDDLDADDFEHPFPALANLAVMLMELYLATPFEKLARRCGFALSGGAESRMRSLDAAVVFNEVKLEMPQKSQFYHAIDRCLDPKMWQDELGRNLDDDLLRTKVYQEVVGPLEDELCDAFHYITVEELDEIAQSVDIGSWGQTIQSQQAAGQTEILSPAQPGV
jgi:hypothetical protein